MRLEKRFEITSVTSSVKRGCNLLRSSTDNSDIGIPLSSARRTAAPDMWCVSRKGTPFLTFHDIEEKQDLAGRIRCLLFLKQKVGEYQILGKICCKHFRNQHPTHSILVWFYCCHDCNWIKNQYCASAQLKTHQIEPNLRLQWQCSRQGCPQYRTKILYPPADLCCMTAEAPSIQMWSKKIKQ